MIHQPIHRKFKEDGSIYPLEAVCNFLQGYLDDDFELTRSLANAQKIKLVKRAIAESKGESKNKSKEESKGESKNESKAKTQSNIIPGNILIENLEHLESCEHLNAPQTIVLAVQIIAARVVIKYCNGEKPHYHRYQVWKKGIMILSHLESQGLIKAHAYRYCHHRDYIFLCRDYSTPVLGTFTLPIHSPCHVYDWPPNEESDIPYSEMPYSEIPTLANIDIKRAKKAAARLIMGYGL